MRVALPESSPGGARRKLRASLVARRRSVPARERQRASLLVARNVDRALPLFFFQAEDGIRAVLPNVKSLYISDQVSDACIDHIQYLNVSGNSLQLSEVAA